MTFIILAIVFLALWESTIHYPEVFEKWPKPKGKLDYYNASESWKYKYKWKYVKGYLDIKIDYLAFLGSKGSLVWLTDAYHLFKMLCVVNINLAIVTISDKPFWWLFIYHAIYFVTFELTLKLLRK